LNKCLRTHHDQSVKMCERAREGLGRYCQRVRRLAGVLPRWRDAQRGARVPAVFHGTLRWTGRGSLYCTWKWGFGCPDLYRNSRRRPDRQPLQHSLTSPGPNEEQRRPDATIVLSRPPKQFSRVIPSVVSSYHASLAVLQGAAHTIHLRRAHSISWTGPTVARTSGPAGTPEPDDALQMTSTRRSSRCLQAVVCVPAYAGRLWTRHTRTRIRRALASGGGWHGKVHKLVTSPPFSPCWCAIPNG
jgi:hypothetical protein